MELTLYNWLWCGLLSATFTFFLLIAIPVRVTCISNLITVIIYTKWATLTVTATVVLTLILASTSVIALFFIFIAVSITLTCCCWRDVRCTLDHFDPTVFRFHISRTCNHFDTAIGWAFCFFRRFYFHFCFCFHLVFHLFGNSFIRRN